MIRLLICLVAASAVPATLMAQQGPSPVCACAPVGDSAGDEAAVPPAHGALPKYLDPSFSIEERITDLLPRLTLEEKVIELSDSWGSQGIPRLRIPAMLKTEGLHGQSYSTGATIYPMPIAMSATFDSALAGRVGKATAEEAKEAGLRVSWSPVLDVARDARWGRVEETYGEDPYWVSRMGVAWIKGFQGEDMIAVPKHFAGHGEPLGGRDSHDVGLSDRVMRTIHLVPFRAAVEEAHAGGVMAAYSTWDGVPDNASVELLQHILREEWSFDGMVVSDCSGPENFVKKQAVAAGDEEAARLAILAGVDINCGSTYATSLAAAVRHGLLKESDLDPNLRRVFRAKYRLGLFDHPTPDKMVWEKLPGYDGPEHRALARKVAVEGSVLLRNQDHLLPLRKDLGTIAVIGPNADLAQTGDYSAKPSPGQLVTVLQGVKAHVGPGTKVLYARGCDPLSMDTAGFAEAVSVAAQAEAVILVVGDNSTREVGRSTTGENVDGATLELPGVQRELVRAVARTGKPLVLVLVNGKPITLAWEAGHIPAILETWYPGEEGGNATADLIFGDRNPSGRLPITFPRHVGQLPLNYDYLPSGRNYDYYDMPFSPEYRFGYGLSYTTFRYDHLKASARPGDPGYVIVTADVTNTGDRDGDEVAQLYITDMLTSVITPVISLQGAQRVSLRKGETRTVTFGLTPYQLSLLDADMTRVLEPGRFRVHVGGVSPAPPEGSEGHKDRIGFTDPSSGVSGEFEVPVRYTADFRSSVEAPASAGSGTIFPLTVTVRNQGNLTGIADIRVYGETLEASYRTEIGPGVVRSHTFQVSLYRGGVQTLTVLVGRAAYTRTVTISRAPARLVLDNVRMSVDSADILQYRAMAVNMGSYPYKGDFGLLVDGHPVAGQLLALDPGAGEEVRLSYTFPRSGAFLVQAGNGAATPLTVPGGVGLALQDPLLYLTLRGGTLDSLSHTVLRTEGIPQYGPGRHGQAFMTGDGATFIRAGGLDLYRKPFTLAAWVRVDSLQDGQAAFFGGQAPMGADVDNTGTALSAGVSGERLLLSFQGRDVRGRAKLPLGEWVHVAYTYDPARGEGTLYLDGRMDRSAPQQPYAGPLDRIGGSPGLAHGAFAMEEVLITRSCLGPDAIAALYKGGPGALREGKVTTAWRPYTGAPTVLRTWADVPSASSIHIMVYTAADGGDARDSVSMEIHGGQDSLSLQRLIPGTRIRTQVRLASGQRGALPILRSLLVEGEGGTLRWSSPRDWSTELFEGGAVRR